MLGGFGSSLSLGGSGALAIPGLYEVYGLKVLRQVSQDHSSGLGPAGQPEAASAAFQPWCSFQGDDVSSRVGLTRVILLMPKKNDP